MFFVGIENDSLFMKKITDHHAALWCHDGFGMELYAIDRVLFVGKRHDMPFFIRSGNV